MLHFVLAVEKRSKQLEALAGVTMNDSPIRIFDADNDAFGFEFRSC